MISLPLLMLWCHLNEPFAVSESPPDHSEARAAAAETHYTSSTALAAAEGGRRTADGRGGASPSVVQSHKTSPHQKIAPKSTSLDPSASVRRYGRCVRMARPPWPLHRRRLRASLLHCGAPCCSPRGALLDQSGVRVDGSPLWRRPAPLWPPLRRPLVAWRRKLRFAEQSLAS